MTGSSLFAQIEEEREREGLESKETRRAHAEREQKIQVGCSTLTMTFVLFIPLQVCRGGNRRKTPAAEPSFTQQTRNGQRDARLNPIQDRSGMYGGRSAVCRRFKRWHRGTAPKPAPRYFAADFREGGRVDGNRTGMGIRETTRDG